ncbi:acylphosphatase [Desulfosporosinus youngiae]|uniref:acylphosphatase n=1 Tax=Desulfosporosinus youngiae TaxID=339862 RepID=UPI0031F38F49
MLWEHFNIRRGFGLRLMYYLKKIRDGYVINQVSHIKLPLFEPSPIIRNRLIFSGRVQKVGFRLETYELAKRLCLTGWVKNRNDKNVEAEIQGENAKILFLIKCLKSLKRASVSDVAIQELPIVDDETNFTVIK